MKVIPRFPLRVVFVLILVAGCAMGIIHYRRQAHRRSAAAMEAITRLGGQAGSFRLAGNPLPNPPPTTFLQRLNDLLKAGPARVDYVLFDRRRIDDTVVKALIDVGEIGDLTLLDCELACSPDTGSVAVVSKLDLGQCKGTPGLLRMCDISRIESLVLDESDAGDDVCDALASARRLKSLSMNNTSFSDRGVPCLSSLSLLSELLLSGTKVTAKSKKLLESLPSIGVLDLSDTDAEFEPEPAAHRPGEEAEEAELDQEKEPGDEDAE